MSVQVLYWQDVPSIVKAPDGSKRRLSDWFQQEIDRRAMEQGLTGSDAYLEQWQWSAPEERPEPPDELVEAIAAAFRAAGSG